MGAVSVYLKSGQTINLHGPAISVENFMQNMTVGPGQAIAFGNDGGCENGFINCDEIAAVINTEEMVYKSK